MVFNIPILNTKVNKYPGKNNNVDILIDIDKLHRHLLIHHIIRT
jgi:hypothetical protein